MKALTDLLENKTLFYIDDKKEMIVTLYLDEDEKLFVTAGDDLEEHETELKLVKTEHIDGYGDFTWELVKIILKYFKNKSSKLYKQALEISKYGM